MSLKILFIGDIIGRLARQALAKILPELKKEYDLDLVIANGENAAHGMGITKKTYDELIGAGIDFVTLGDHAFDKDEVNLLLADQKNPIIRPANFPPQVAGQGAKIIDVGSKKVLVVNLVGRVFMKMDYDCPFRKIDEILDQYKDQKLSAIIVDFHAEATSEKTAFGWYVDGRVSAVLGTHTHVPTADTKILPKGTAFNADVGMVGAADSVIGVNKEAAIKGFLYQTPRMLEPVEDGQAIINSVLIEVDSETKKAIAIKRVDKLI